MLADDDNQPIKRAPVVYGKRSIPRSPVVSPDEQARPFEHAHHSPTAPPQPPRSARSLNASDTERSPSPGADTPFKFGFRHTLRELDERFKGSDVESERGPSSGNKAVHADLSQVKDLQSVPMGTTVLSFEVPHASGEHSRSSSPPLSSLPTTSTQEYPLDSPPVRQRARRVQNSGSETDEPSRSSSVSPLRHAITTPHSRSSPTPPTSGEVTMPSRKAKGKAPARDVLPLFFDGEGPSPSEASKPKKGRRSESLAHPKTKAPTKKERREATFESSRIAASRPVEVRRTQEQKYSLSTFFTNLRRDNIAIPGALGTELPSDPIERFSSPTEKSTRVEPEDSAFGRSMGPLVTSSVDMGSIGRSSSSGGPKALPPPAAADSDDEMPFIASIIQQADGKRQRLHAIKQVALRHADTNKAVDDDSEDDDLLIVKDDMHSVARQEAVQRRLDKAHGSPVKDRDTLRRLNHPSIRPVALSPRKLSKQELQELAKPSFDRTGKRAKGQLNKNQLDQLVMMKHAEEQLKSIKRQEEEWVKRGGKLSRNTDTGSDDARNSLSRTVEAYAAEGLKAVVVVDGAKNEAASDESDEDYIPDIRSASPEPVEESNAQGDNINMDVSSVPQPLGDDLDHDEELNALRRRKYGQRRPHVVGSDDEEVQPGQHSLPAVQRDSTSMESQTEDENDKENKAIVHHKPSPEVTFGPRLGSLHDIEDGDERSLSLASAMNPDYTVGSPNGVRPPLKDISKDENDFFLSLPSKPLFTDRLPRSATRSPSHASTSTHSLGLSPTLRSERINRIARFSLDSRSDENDPPGFKVPRPSFLERLQSQSSPEPSLPCFNPLACGGFSQLFSAEEQGPNQSVDRASDGLALTLDVGLKPALEVGNTLRRKAEAIFEKEQEYVVAAVVEQSENDKPKEEVVYINDHGFLTQTRPEGSSPQIYRTTPSQATKFIGTQARSPQTQSLDTRPPLRTLSFTASQVTSPDSQPLRRLRRRSLSPLEHKITGKNGNRKDAFAILGKARDSLSKEQEKKHEKSEFVAAEAEESDEDDMFGFGGPKGDEEEEDDNEQDKIVEGLVDDTVMDAEMEAVDLVQEKFREHEEEDDQRLQKLHEDATKGKFRIKRRNRAVGFEDDSDEDDDDDNNARRIRGWMSKKRRKIEDDNLEVLGQNEETRAFYDTYHQDLIDMDDEFGYLRGDAGVPTDDNDARAEEPQEIVSMDEIRRRVREVAENNDEVEVLDPEDISWVDQAMNMEPDDLVAVKTVECRRGKPLVRRANAVDFDEERSVRIASEQERKQMTSWAKGQSRQHQGTARSGNSTAITGHARTKFGGGLLRSTQSSRPPTANATRATKTASLLSTVSNRSGKFS